VLHLLNSSPFYKNKGRKSAAE